MKTKVFLVLMVCAIIFNNGKAQTYQSVFGKESTVWTYANYQFYFPTPIDNDRDTIIDNLSCKGASHVTFYCENEDNSKFYRITLKPEKKKILLMDLNLEVGDTCPLPFDKDEPKSVITEIKKDSSGRKVLITDRIYGWQEYFNMAYIEGVGPIALCSGSNICEILLCVEKDGEKVWQSPLWPDCYFDGVGIKEKSNNNKGKKETKLVNYKTGLTFHFPVIEDGTYKITDVFGKEVLKNKIKNSGIINENISSFPEGVYIISVYNKKQLMYNEKFKK